MELFNKLGLSENMSASEIQASLKKSKHTWTTRESSGLDHVRREAEQMTECISLLRELMDELPAGCPDLYLCLQTAAECVERAPKRYDDIAAALKKAVGGDVSAKKYLSQMLAGWGCAAMAGRWYREQPKPAPKPAPTPKPTPTPTPKPVTTTTTTTSTKTGSTSSSTGSSSTYTGTYKPPKKHHFFRNLVVLVLVILAVFSFVGPERWHPIENIKSLVETLQHRSEDGAASDEFGTESMTADEAETMDLSGVTLPESLCTWDFSTSLEEQHGYPATVYGDCAVVDILGDGSCLAASFDGDGDYLDLGSRYNMADAFTLNILLNCTDTTKQYAAFFAKYETNSYGPYAYSIRDGHVNCWVSLEDGSHVEMDSDAEIGDGTWHLITIVHSDNWLQLYIDGVADQSMEWQIPVSQNEDPVTIGRQAYLYAPEDQLQFTGFIRRIDLYTEAFSEEQVLRSCQDLNVDALPALWLHRTIRETDGVPLWGELDAGGFEVIDTIPADTPVVYLEDVNEEYVRVSYHGKQGNINKAYLNMD